MLSDEQIYELVTSSPTLEESCTTLIERANFYGGIDNITAILAKIEDGDSPTSRMR
jgi:protein phosphatase